MDALRWKVLLKWMITEGTPFFSESPRPSFHGSASWQPQLPRKPAFPRMRLSLVVIHGNWVIWGTLFKGYPHETYRKHHGKNETSRNQTCSSNVLLGTPTTSWHWIDLWCVYCIIVHPITLYTLYYITLFFNLYYITILYNILCDITL